MPVTHSDFKEWKSFHIGDVLTIITGIMVSPQGIGGVYTILNWMTGEDLFTNQLIRATNACAPFLRDLYPELSKVEIPDTTNVPEGMQAEFWQEWLAEQVLQFGEDLPVPKLVDHEAVDPFKELANILEKNNSSAKIILFDPESPESEMKYLKDRLAEERRSC